MKIIKIFLKNFDAKNLTFYQVISVIYDTIFIIKCY